MTDPRALSEARELARWQRKLLPFAIAAISLMALFFFATSLLQIDRLGKAISYKPSAEVERSLAAYERRPDAAAPDLAYMQWKTRVLLERDALSHRYAQVNATLMLRAWTRHLGFLTGMILAMVGSVFILAKLREGETTLSGEGAGAKAALATSSPGIVLAVLGTVLMVVTLTANFEFSTTDVPVYIGRESGGGGAAMPAAPDLTDEGARQSEEAQLFGAPGAEQKNGEKPDEKAPSPR